MNENYCLVCGNKDLKYYGEKGVIRLLICQKCGFGLADRNYWKDPYENLDYYEKNPVEVSYPLKFSKTEIDRLNVLKKYLNEKNELKILDFGSGYGTTAIALKKLFNSYVTAIDSSKLIIEMCQKYHPEIEWICSNTIPDHFQPSSYDVVTMFHILEHILNPQEIMCKVAKILKPDGFLLIEVPNFNSMMRKIKRMNWIFVVDHHVNYFSKKNLKLFIEKFGFTLVDVEYRRTFAINENQSWKEPLKKFLCYLGFGDILRCLFIKEG